MENSVSAADATPCDDDGNSPNIKTEDCPSETLVAGEPSTSPDIYKSNSSGDMDHVDLKGKEKCTDETCMTGENHTSPDILKSDRHVNVGDVDCKEIENFPTETLATKEPENCPSSHADKSNEEAGVDDLGCKVEEKCSAETLVTNENAFADADESYQDADENNVDLKEEGNASLEGYAELTTSVKQLEIKDDDVNNNKQSEEASNTFDSDESEYDKAKELPSSDDDEAPVHLKGCVVEEVDRSDPAFVPKRGGFYQHDLRVFDESAQTQRVPRKQHWDAKSSKWQHDKFDFEEQAPKTKYEIVSQYGYDIRDDNKVPPPGFRRRYNRGGRDFIKTGGWGRQASPPFDSSELRNHSYEPYADADYDKTKTAPVPSCEADQQHKGNEFVRTKNATSPLARERHEVRESASTSDQTSDYNCYDSRTAQALSPTRRNAPEIYPERPGSFYRRASVNDAPAGGDEAVSSFEPRRGSYKGSSDVRNYSLKTKANVVNNDSSLPLSTTVSKSPPDITGRRRASSESRSFASGRRSSQEDVDRQPTSYKTNDSKVNAHEESSKPAASAGTTKRYSTLRQQVHQQHASDAQDQHRQSFAVPPPTATTVPFLNQQEVAAVESLPLQPVYPQYLAPVHRSMTSYQSPPFYDGMCRQYSRCRNHHARSIIYS
ncbi:unnamed protein product [Soboliphyme baturini]|uniref:Protein CASC3 n=1 Tax=Soboliphyme baturini TaxID=241478 RepID=A0A183IEQ6_9BILA|nr:unnamed protein product [Soboliphyme baturini]